MGTTHCRTCLALLGLGVLVGGVAASARAQQGSIAGQVTDQATGHPLAGARITIQGTALVTSSNAEGRYTLRNVPAGAITVRATFIGYAAATRGLTVAPGEAATADLALKLTPYTLDAVVSTVSGDQTRKETPNAISTVRADSLVQTRPITNMNDLLGARVPGVEVLPGNITGAGARVRIRGTSSLSLNNEPIYVIDGVRMESANNSSSIGIGGTNPSRVNDIDPNEIESYDVVKGPAASTCSPRRGLSRTTTTIRSPTARGPLDPRRAMVLSVFSRRPFAPLPTHNTASRTASPRSTCSRIPTPRRWARGTGSSMDCKYPAGPMSLATSCPGSGRMSGGCCGCLTSPGAASSLHGRSTRCPTSSTGPTRAAARTCAPTCRRTSRRRSTSRCRPDSSPARSGCRRPTTTRSASCPTGSAGRDSRGSCSRQTTCRCSATACTHRISSSRRL